MINKDFYPTPRWLVEKMFYGVKLQEIKTILEPSAGKGDIVDYILERYDRNFYNKPSIDCVEIDKDLTALLKGKKYRVVYNDFLTFSTFKHYDLIIANFPFSEGDKHLLKALDMQKNGGGIICLVNAETIKNPYTNVRKDIVQRLTDLNAQIEFIEDAFVDAERKTNVEVALIKVFIPPKEESSLFFEGLKSKTYNTHEYNSQELTTFASQNEYIELAVEQFNREVESGIKLINEYYAMKPYLKERIEKDTETKSCTRNDNIIKLTIGNDDVKYITHSQQEVINKFVEAVRYKYWEALFNDEKFVKNLTSNLVNSLNQKLDDLRNYDFCVYNIMTIQQELIGNTIKGIEDTILDLFEEFSVKYSWNAETSKNIHYYNGWATNKAYKINSKIILPYNAYDSIWGRLDLGWKQTEKFTDLIKTLDYLAGKTKLTVDVRKIFNETETTQDIDLGYFTCTFYKKGTCHIKFKDLELLEKLNLYGSQRKGWLFHDFGRKKYKDMSQQEKNVVDEFCGSEENYSKIFKAQDYYLLDGKNLLALNY